MQKGEAEVLCRRRARRQLSALHSASEWSEEDREGVTKRVEKRRMKRDFIVERKFGANG